MDFQTVYTAVTTRTNEASSTATNVAKANVNFAYHDICSRHTFSWLMSTGTLTTTASQAHSVISTAGITDLWKIVSIREAVTPRRLIGISRSSYESMVARDNTTTAMPEFYCDEYDDRVYWYHTPADAYTMYVTYRKIVTDRSANGDTFIIPARHQEVLVLGGWYKQLEYLKQYNEASAVKAEFESFLQKMIDDDEDREDEIEIQSNHLIGGVYDGGPVMPENYRRY